MRQRQTDPQPHSPTASVAVDRTGTGISFRNGAVETAANGFIACAMSLVIMILLALVFLLAMGFFDTNWS